MISAIAQADSLDPVAIRNQIAATKDYPGVIGTYQGFDANGDTIPQWTWLEQYENGQWVVVYPSYLEAVKPVNGLNDTPVNIYIYGTNFSPNSTAKLVDGTTEIAIEGLLFVDSGKLRGTVPVGIPPGVYDLVLDYGGEETVLPDAYESLDPASNDDLLVLDAADLWSDPPGIQAGETVRLGLTIRRQGGTGDLVNVAADFYLGQPETGSLIRRGTVPRIPSNGTGAATVSWTAPDAGYHTLYAVIDPEDAIDENPENNIISRTVRVLPAIPAVPPTVESFTINDGAADSDSPQVLLNVSAPGASYLLYVEYEYIQSQRDWVPVAMSEWLPYGEAQADYAWKLQPAPGVHYLQAWAADLNGLISLEPGVSFINYLPASAFAATGQIYAYRYALISPETLLARLTSLTGDADLYAWDPEGVDAGRSETSDPVEVVTVTVTADGIYQLEVEGFSSADFRLEINPSTTLRTSPSTMLRTSPAGERVDAGILSPTPRGRGTPLTVTVPDEDIGLPETPWLRVFLPAVSR